MSFEPTTVFTHPTTDEVLQNKRFISTRKQYETLISKINFFFENKFSEDALSVFNEQGMLLDTLPHTILMAILVDMSAKNLPDGSVSMKSNSSFTATGSAISYWHEISNQKKNC